MRSGVISTLVQANPGQIRLRRLPAITQNPTLRFGNLRQSRICYVVNHSALMAIPHREITAVARSMRRHPCRHIDRNSLQQHERLFRGASMKLRVNDEIAIGPSRNTAMVPEAFVFHQNRGHLGLRNDQLSMAKDSQRGHDNHRIAPERWHWPPFLY